MLREGVGVAKQYTPNRNSPIKIVYRQGKKFVCGMCRNTYQSAKEAKSCLRDDIERMVNLQPVQVVKRGDEIAYRCSICARDYDNHEQAFSCARECKYELDKKRVLEEKITGIPLKPPDLKKFTKRAPVAISIQQVTKLSLKRKDLEHKPASIDESVKAPTQLEELTSAEAKGAEKSAAPQASKKPAAKVINDREKFYREDAKYVCSSCNKKFFTKIEVEQCFDGHSADEQSA
jgi:hypothetical protein